MANSSKIYSNASPSPQLYVLNPEQTATTPSSSTPRQRKRKMPRYARLLLGALALYLLVYFTTGGYEIWKLKQQMLHIEAEKQLLLEQRSQLENEIKSLQDPEIIEKIARESLGMVKKGETIVVPAVPGHDIPKPKEVEAHDLLE